MKTHCLQPEFFESFVEYYRKNLFRLRKLEKSKVATLNTTLSWPTLNFLGKGLVLFLATAGQGLVFAQSLPSSSTKSRNAKLIEAPQRNPLLAPEPMGLNHEKPAEPQNDA